ncbi:hypothetical protein CEK25_012837 [Fusarium fujikuroi]|nr:hypothetical protein CEK25_012837 [Fusarium fujikuroi]
MDPLDSALKQISPDRDYQWGKPDGIGFLEFVDEAADSCWVAGLAAFIKLAFDLNKASGIDSLALLHEAWQNQLDGSREWLLGIGKIVNNAERSYKQTPLTELVKTNYEEKAVKLYKLLASTRDSISSQNAEHQSWMHDCLRTYEEKAVTIL